MYLQLQLSKFCKNALAYWRRPLVKLPNRTLSSVIARLIHYLKQLLNLSLPHNLMRSNNVYSIQ